MAHAVNLEHAARQTGTLIVAALLGAAACGGSQLTPEAALTQAGPVPSVTDWQGVYKSPRHGHLHLIVHENRVDGAWRTTVANSYGRLWGTIEGKVLRYNWTEQKRDASAKDALDFGRGYFVFVMPEEGQPPLLIGEVSSGKGESKEPWKARKRPEIEPNLWYAHPRFDGDRFYSVDDQGNIDDYFDPSSEELP